RFTHAYVCPYHGKKHDNSRQGPPEPLVRLLNVHLELARLLLAQLLSGAHLVEGDEPLDNLAAAVKVLVGDAVDRLDHVGEERVELVRGQHAELDGVEEGDELLRRLEDQHAARVVGGGGGGGRRRGEGRGRDGGGAHADAEALGRAGGLELEAAEILVS